MRALSVTYHQKRPNVEAGDMTALVIRALGLIVGKLVRDEGGMGGMGGIGGGGGTSNKGYFILNKLIRTAAQALIETQELDIPLDVVTSQRVARVLKKMRLLQHKQPKSSNRGWIISMDDLYKV